MRCLTRERERERETKPRPLREYMRRPMKVVLAKILRPGDIIHDSDNRELRGLVVHTREADWGAERVVWVQTSEDTATRWVDWHSTLLITRGI